jgi:hypothetical protein
MIEPASTEEKQKVRVRVRVRHKKSRSKKHYVLGGILLFLFLASSILSVVGYQTYNTRYHNDLSLAQAGIQHLQKAQTLMTTWSQKPLDVQITAQAKQEFVSALKTFSMLNTDLQSLPVYARQVPVYGTRVSAALHLASLASALSQAGVGGSDILNILMTELHAPLASQGHGLTLSDLTMITGDIKQVKLALAQATNEMNQLQPSDMQFDSRIPKLVDTLHKELPMVQGWLNAVEQLLPVAPALLGIGTPANYLIEVLDSTELRPGGGFIGNYGIATLSGGQLTAAHITDVDLLDRPFEAAGHVIAYPSTYSWFDLVPSSWSFRDSNLDADFPTAARYGEQTYKQEGGNVPIQGVIAITPGLIQQILTITGPISVPEYHEVVTSENLIARIHFHQLGGSAAGEGSDLIPSPDGHSSLRKRFTELLAEHLLDRVRQISSSALPKLLLLMISSVHSKDIQLYFNLSSAENLLAQQHLDAAIQSSASDSLFIVDANISPNKANNFFTYTLNDEVNIDINGDAMHHTTISYAWLANGQNYGRGLYRDYVRVYVPADSTLQAQDGWKQRGTSTAFGREVWAGLFTLSHGQTRIITLDWKVPSVAKKDQQGWHYQDTIQKQAGVQWKLNLRVNLPSCSVATNKWQGLLSKHTQYGILTQSLNEDLNVGVDYACK